MTGRAITFVCTTLVATLGACDDRTVAPQQSSLPATLPTGNASQTLAWVRRITAEQLGVKAEELDVNKPLSAFKADELDLVELVMECEDRFQVSIPDEAIAKMVGSATPQDGLKLSIAQLAQLVEQAPRQPTQKTSQP